MVENPKFAIKILEKIGAPLAAAIESVPLKAEDTEVEAAKIMAQMMGQAVQISIALNSSLNINDNDEGQADSLRLALAALAAPLLADFYRQNERVPEDQDIKRIIKAQEAVLAFAENFTAASEEKSRLTTIDHDAPFFDETQVSLAVLQSLTPVITAIAEFPFGQSETKLLQDVAEKLKKDAADIAKNGKLGEVMAVKALAQLYADCHRAETQRLASASDENRGELSLDPVWDAYRTRVAMVEAVMGAQTSTGVQSASGPSPAAETPAQAQAPAAPPPQEQTPAAPPPPVSAPPAAAAPSSGNPMGFFKQGGNQAQTPAAPPPSAPPAAAPPQEQAPAASTPPAGNPPPPAAPAESNTSGSAANPMGFFKPGAKKEDDSGSTVA